MKERIKPGATALVILLLFGSIFVAGASAVPKDNKAEKMVKKIERDLKETGKYSEKDLDEFVKVLEESLNVELSEEEKKAVKEYALREIRKKIKLEKFKGRTTTSTSFKPRKTITADSVAYEIEATIGPVYWFVQPTDDITGGSGYDNANPPNYYNINGNNTLYNVEVDQIYLYADETYCTVNGLAELYLMYTMYYYDEDHPSPTWDSYYDWLRQQIYGRIEDIETFYVRVSDNSICFDGIWSNDKTFAVDIGQHGYAEFLPTNTVFIAVWNHALDVDDENDNLAKTWHYY